MKTALSVILISLITKNAATNVASIGRWEMVTGDRNVMDRDVIEIDGITFECDQQTFGSDHHPIKIDQDAIECDQAALLIDLDPLALDGNTFECDRAALMIDYVAFECEQSSM